MSPAEASSLCRLGLNRRLWSLSPCWPSSHLANYSKFSLVSSTLVAATRRAMNIKQFCITCAGLLLMFINNEYSYFAQNSVRIIEDLDNRSADNRGSTVYMYKHYI